MHQINIHQFNLQTTGKSILIYINIGLLYLYFT